jgi:DNA-binding beta-propeller fold protein YncE
MSHSSRVGFALVVSFVALALMLPVEPSAQVVTNPYRAVYDSFKLPTGRTWGVPAGIYEDPDKKHIWVMDRCGGNNCAGVDVDPFLKFDLNGNFVKSFGKGVFGWPHGFFVDHEGNVWGTEGGPVGERRGEPGFKMGKGHQVHKFSPDGKLLLSLGVANVAGDDQTHFNGPSHVAVDRNGDIWVTDGHRGGNNRLVRYSKDGKFKMQIGGGIKSASHERGLFNDPHNIAFDSQGRIFISDRGNNRIQIFDPEGKFLSVWYQFGRPSSVAIDANDTIYAIDGTSNPRSNPGWEKGIRIGSARTGWVTHFIPELQMLNPETGGTVDAEFIGVDHVGNIYAGEVQGQKLVKYVRSPWFTQPSGPGQLTFQPASR